MGDVTERFSNLQQKNEIHGDYSSRCACCLHLSSFGQSGLWVFWTPSTRGTPGFPKHRLQCTKSISSRCQWSPHGSHGITNRSQKRCPSISKSISSRNK